VVKGDMRRLENCSIIVLTGGFGNQLFQFTYGLYLEETLGYSVFFDCDLGKPREVGNCVALFNINLANKVRIIPSGNRLFTTILQKCYGWNLAYELKEMNRVSFKSVVMKFLTKTLLRCRFGRRRLICVSNDLGFDESLPLQKNALYFGYFQTYIYASDSLVFDKLKSINLHQVSLKYLEMIAEIKKEKPFLLHVRLTDYTSERSFGIPSVDYYQNALGQLLQNDLSKSVWVISDDVNAAKEYLGNILHRYEIRYFDEANLSDLEVWNLMREFSGYVLSNSSFAWWAAYLRRDSKAKIYAPEPWFHGMGSPNQLLPEDWVRVQSL